MNSTIIPIAVGMNIILYAPSDVPLNEVERFVRFQLVEAFKYQNVLVSHVEVRSTNNNNESSPAVKP